MTKHTLLATTGASPQVVTETLYAIHHENMQWPDDIYIITTSRGAKNAVQGLIDQGHLQRLCDELNRPVPKFDTGHVLITPGANGQDVEDARSLEDHEALADFITTQVRERTTDSDTSLHASLAGGRKTMTFYLGYAMSLFGRPQDILSHVLISEGYENVPGFWFPTQTEPHRYVTNQGKELDASKAKVTLAPIPFVRLRDGLPQQLLAGDADFIQTVNAIQQSLEPARLEIYRDSGKRKPTVKCGNQKVELAPLQLAWLIWWAERAQKKEPTLAPREKDECSNLPADRFLQIYGNIENPERVAFLPSPDRKLVAQETNKYKSMKTNLAGGIYKKFFEQGISKLEKSLKEQLGQYRAVRYMIQRKRNYGQTIYSLDIAPDAILIDLE